MKLNAMPIVIALLMLAINSYADTAVASASCEITYTVRLAFVGNGTSDAFVQSVKDAIDAKWNQPNLTCGDCKCKLKVVVDARNLGRDKTCNDVPPDYSCVNVVDTAGGPHRSFVWMGVWSGGKINSSASEFSSADSFNILAHELGHYMGLDDEYEDYYCYYRKDSRNRTVGERHCVRKADFNASTRQGVTDSAPPGGWIEYIQNGDGGFEISLPKDGVPANSLMASIGADARVLQSHVDILKQRSGADCPPSCCCGNGVVDASVAEVCDWKADPTGCPRGSWCGMACSCLPFTVGRLPNTTVTGNGTANRTVTGNTTVLPNATLVTPNTTSNTSMLPLCGNSRLDANEQCDGAQTTCFTGQSCVQCKCITPPPVCGNGKLETNEQCDGSASSCLSGQICTQGCKCVYPEPVCGNGKMETGEQCEAGVLECSSSGYSCVSCKCKCTDADNDYACDNVDNCVGAYNPTQSDSDGDGKGDKCDSTPVSCSSVCAQRNLTVNSNGENSQSSCQAIIQAQGDSAMAEIPAPECFTTCKYFSTTSGFVTVSSSEFSYSCCCTGQVSTWSTKHACSDCPGQNPVCPDPDVVCTQTGT